MHQFSNHEENNLVKGSIYALLGFFFMALLGVFTKVAALEAGKAVWISIITYFTGAVIICLVETFQGTSGVRTSHPWKHFFRAAFGVAASFLYLLSLQKIPMVNATLLFNTSPIFIPILTIFWLGDAVSKKSWAAVLLGFLGIVVIIRPTGEIFEQAGDFFGLASGISLAVAYLLIKILTKTEPSYRIIFYFFVIGFILQLPFIYIAGSFPEWHTLLYSSLAGLSLTLAQLFLVLAYRNANASQVGVYQYSSVVFVGLMDWIFWGVVPPMFDLIGVLLVIIAGSIIIREKISST